MALYAARRLLIAIPTILLSTVVVFFMLRVLPGDVALILAVGVDASGVASEETIDRIREQLGLNQNVFLQYFTWVFNVIRGDLGTSLFTKRSVASEILSSLPLTAQLAIMAQVLAMVIGVPLGVLSAVKRDTPIDVLARFWAILFLAMPQFWVALMFLLGTVFLLNWSPPLGYFLLWEDPVNNMLQLLPAAMVLGLGGAAIVARMTRSSMLEVLGEDYIRTARAKGLAETTVILRHALRNALIPVVTISSITFAFLLAGTVILETVFAIPGLGLLILTSIRTRDFIVVQALVLFSAVAVILINLAIDLIYGWLDPRISYR